MSKIKLEDVKRIIKEEIKNLNEQVDHQAIKDVVNSASKLLAAIESFKKDAPADVLGSVVEQVSSLEKILENMVNTPAAYVSKPKPEVKKVSLKPVK